MNNLPVLTPVLSKSYVYCLSLLIYLLLFFCGVAWSSKTHAGPTPEFVEFEGDGSDPNQLISGLMLFEDPTGQKRLKDVLSTEEHLWRPNRTNILELNYSQSTWWIQIPLRNDGDYPIKKILELDWPMLDYLDIYLVSRERIQQSWLTGDQRPVESRPMKTRNFAIPIELEGRTSLTLMMRLALRNGVFDAIPLRLWDDSEYFKHDNDRTLAHGLFFGAGLGLLLFNILLALALKERVFYYYVGYLGLFLLWRAGYLGFGFLYLWPSHPGWNNFMNLALPGLAHLGATLFVTHYLETRINTPRLHWILLILTSGILVLAAISAADVAGIRLPTAQLFGRYLVLSSVLLVLYIWSGLVLSLRGHKSSRYFLLGWSMLVLGGLVAHISGVPGGYISRNLFTENSLNIGASFEFIFLALALGDRYKLLREEKNALEQRAFALAMHYSDQLEKQVRERTEELEDVIVQMNNALEAEQGSAQEQREFFHSIAHELRTPLAIIDTIAQNLLLGTDANNQERLNTRYENIGKSTSRMVRVFDELLDEDRFIRVAQHLKIQPCNPRKLLQDAADAAGIFAMHATVRVENFFIPETWELDQALVKIALRTLADNAVKYTPEGGRVVLSGGRRQGRIWFEVFNTGAAIDADDLAHIFDKGFRGKNVGNKPGTGYGLALARNAIEKHGGKLTLESIPGRGTRARIWLD